LEKIIWENTATIHNVLNKKTLQSYILNKLNIKKIKSTDTILEKKNNKKKNREKKPCWKYCSNSQCFVMKATVLPHMI
jgi:DNA helicase IV